MEAKEFLDNFLKKEIMVSDGHKRVPVRILQCPKCDVKGRVVGTFTNPIMFIAHLIQDCPDFTEYLKEAKIFSFLKEQDLSSFLKDLMKQVQGILTPVGVKT